MGKRVEGGSLDYILVCQLLNLESIHSLSQKMINFIGIVVDMAPS